MAAPAAEPASHQPRARCHSRDQRRSGNRETARRRGKLAGLVRCDAGDFTPLAALPPALADAVRPESMCWSRRIRRGELALAEAPGRVPPGRRRSLAGTGARQERRPLGRSARAGGPTVLDDASTGRGRCCCGAPGFRPQALDLGNQGDPVQGLQVSIQVLAHALILPAAGRGSSSPARSPAHSCPPQPHERMSAKRQCCDPVVVRWGAVMVAGRIPCLRSRSRAMAYRYGASAGSTPVTRAPRPASRRAKYPWPQPASSTVRPVTSPSRRKM
jgi:hypothetical protein